MSRFCFCAALMLGAFSCHAITGNQALQYMAGDQDTSFLAYMRATMDAEGVVFWNARAARKGGEEYIRPFCAPLGSDAAQAARIVRREMRENPDKNHENLFIITRRALVAAWPCTDAQLGP